ncbi:MAG: HAD family phosphatase [Acidobacteria bacterium]|jgi:HAD superfamily hydrolase (TIGR01509 family)|nr:HAD family phosphatase [Acidobacteriota bacterium]
MAAKAIIFDMDGLMIDSERLYRQAQQDIAIQFNKIMTEEIRMKMMGRKPIESLRLFVEELNIPMDPAILLEMRNNVMREKLKNELVPMPGLSHIIETFHGKLKLAVCTGAQEEFLNIVVDKLGIRNKFTILQNSDDIEKGKPDPEIYLKTCRRLGLNPRECIVLEDSLNGVLAGKQAGCYVIAVPSEYTRCQNFDAADFVAENLFNAAKHIELEVYTLK